MNRKTIFLLLALIALIAWVIVSNPRAVTAQSGGGYDLTWNTFDGGGGTSTGGAYSLSGTIGQSDAGTQSGGSYTLQGGFWQDFLGNKLNLPLILR